VEAIAAAVDRTRELLAIADRMDRAQSTSIRSGQIELALSGLPASMPDIVRSDRLEGIVHTITEASASAARTRVIEEALSGLPEAVPAIIRSDALIQAGRDIKLKAEHVENVARQGEILARLPAAMPQMRDASRIEGAVAAIISLDQDRERIASEGKRIETEAATCERELHELTEAMGHSCPVCGGGIDDPHVLVGHNHVHGKEYADA
jgi:DNA repair exonuclease SbcCD ATPase subunit